MIGALFLIIFLSILSWHIPVTLKRRNKFINVRLLRSVFVYHFVFWAIYFAYTLANRSDSVMYYKRAKNAYQNWFHAYSTGTPFIDFVAYPFVQLGFSYEMMMVLFAWFGYLGFVYFYIFFRENTRFRHNIFGYDLLTVLLFLPNMHFWTASLGKGSLIFLGLGMAIYGLSRVEKRKIPLIAGLAIVYHVRPHVFLFMMIGIIVGLFTGRQKVKAWQKILVVVAGGAAMFLLYDKILAFAGLDSEDVVGSFDDFSSGRSAELAKSGSGIDTSQYPLVLKLITFWFRPLFFDAPGALGIVVSFENLLYVIISARLFNKQFPSFVFKGPALVKTSLIIFLVASIALSATMGNLGIIIRQKSMVMYFYFFVILMFLDWQKIQSIQAAIARKKRREAKQRALQMALK